MYLIRLIYSLSALYFADCYNILVLYPLPVRSINLLGEGVVRNLLNSSHEVTYVTSYPMKTSNPKLKQIDISKNIPIMMDMCVDILNVTKVMQNEVNFESGEDFLSLVLTLAEATLGYKNVQKLMMKDRSTHFDAVIADLCDTEVYAGFAALFDCPMMWFFSIGPHTPALRLVDGPPNPAYTADYMSSNVPPFTFTQRLEELWSLLHYEYTKRFIALPKEEAIYKKAFGPHFEARGKKLPNYYDLSYNASIVFINDYHTFGNVPSTPQNLIFIGGQHIEKPTKPLPEVTYVTSYPMKTSNPKLKQIDISKNIPIMMDMCVDILNVTKVMQNEVNFESGEDFLSLVLTLAEATLGYKNVQKLMMKDRSTHFDAVIADLCDTEVYAGFAALFDCPMMWFFSIGPHTPALRLVDGPPNPAYTADYMSSNVPPFTFTQRLEELWSLLHYEYTKRFIALPKEEAIYKKAFGPHFEARGKKLPNYYDLSYNASIVFINDYHTFGNVPSTPQNLIFIGGQHIEKPTKPLPEDLQSLMDNTKHGVIYFSLGSTWKSKDMPKSLIDRLLKMFGELKQTVIWKFEEALENVPRNVHTIKWAPQHSILNHPNLLLFISHGGQLSTTEAVHFAVPVIGVPIFMDQHINIRRAVQKGYALKVPLSPNLPVDLKKAIETMVGDKKYKERVKEVSFIYHDRPISAGAELVHWVSHVIRTRGAPHLRSPALMVPWYQKVYLDLIVMILAVLVVLMKLLKGLMRMVKGKQSGKSKKKMN